MSPVAGAFPGSKPPVHADRHGDEVRDILAESIFGAHIVFLRLVEQVGDVEGYAQPRFILVAEADVQGFHRVAIDAQAADLQ